MSKGLEIGIVGLPNVGKSSLFNALTKNNVLVANYPFATIEPNIGVVNVPDKRLINLEKLYQADKVTHATINFIDIAGLVAGASTGEGLGNQFLNHIRQTDTIIQVVRAFKDTNITHINDNHNPKDDIDIINTELVLADLQSIEKQIPKIEKEIKSNPKLKVVLENANLIKSYLNNNEPLWQKSGIDYSIVKNFHLITTKPVIYLFNLDENDLTNNELKLSLTNLVKPSPVLFLSAKLETELTILENEEASELLKLYSQNESGLEQLVKSAYQTLGLQSFLTAGKKEVRAWTIHQGSTAPEAAGVIHNDFQRGFIAAEIIDYFDLIKFGSYSAVKQAGKIRLEGKNYIMQENDIVDFKFNV